ETHAVELAGLFLETSDQEHRVIGGEFLVLGKMRRSRRLGRRFGLVVGLGAFGRLSGGSGHASLPVRNLRNKQRLLIEGKLARRIRFRHAQTRMAGMPLTY